MKELSLSAINARSTLPVSLTGGGSFTFSFKDDSFIVGFVKDFTILDEGVYQFFIESKNKADTSGNKDVRKTISSRQIVLNMVQFIRGKDRFYIIPCKSKC
ncbi:MAG: hypothetical protein MJY60_03880 [Bacteroidales bacterium]|nr:hypothetical protein [Bacteroidales bacterium]